MSTSKISAVVVNPLTGAKTTISASVGVTPTPPPPPPSTMIVGAAPGTMGTLSTTESFTGNLEALRIFYSGGLPASYSALGMPAGKLAYVSYKSASANTVGFAKSCPAGTRIIYHHEPENDYSGNGAAFVAEFVAQYAIIKAANPNVIAPMACMTYQYTGGRFGQSGSYLPPATHCDEYLCDDYLPKITLGGLGSKPDFQGWYNLVKGRGKPLGFAEYGRGVNPVGTADQWTTLRPQVMATDRAWIKAHPGFNALLYWYFTGAAGDWRFHDAGSKAALQAFNT